MHVLLFAAVQASCWIGIRFARAADLRAKLDDDLRAHGEATAELVKNLDFQNEPERAGAQVATLLATVSTDAVYVVQTATGRTLASSHAGPATALIEQHVRTLPPQSLVISDMETPGASSAPGQRVRVASLRSLMSDGKPVVISVGRQLWPLEQTLRQLDEVLVLSGVISVMFVFVASWSIASRTLAPIGNVARRARELSSSGRMERIPLPGTGDELEQLVVVVNDMLDRLRARLREQREFLVNAAHELRTPVAVLLGEASSLERTASVSDPVHEFVRSAQEECHRLLRNIESVLAVTRLRDEPQPAFADHVAIDEIVLDAVRSCRREAEAREIRVIPLLQTDTRNEPLLVAGDEDLLRTMAEQLVHCCVAHTVPRTTVEVALEVNETDVVLRVKGRRSAGATAAESSSVVTLTNSKRSGTNSGLTPYMVGRIAEAHGGTLEMHSEDGEDCIAEIRLPLLARSASRGAQDDLPGGPRAPAFSIP